MPRHQYNPDLDLDLDLDLETQDTTPEKMSTRMHDAIVVGSGAAGGWAAKELAEAGLDVLLLEAGPPVGGTSKATSLARYPTQSKCEAFRENTSPLFADDIDNPYVTPAEAPFLWIRARIVGGRMTLWDGVCLRMSDADLHPSDPTAESWPIAYADLVWAYDKVEDFIGVAGTRDGLPLLPDGRFVPPPALNLLEEHFRAKVEGRWPDRRVIPLRRATRSHAGVLDAALATGRVTLRPNAVVARVLSQSGPQGARATGVEIVDAVTRDVSEAHARVVVLCASAIESARILLCSRTPRFPDGLANTSGTLGRYLFDHNFLSGSFDCALPKGIRAAGPLEASRCYVPRFRNASAAHAAFRRGYGIEVGISADGRGGCQVELGAIGEVLPRFESRVTLTPERRDAWSIPVPRIDFAYGANEAAMQCDEAEVFRELLEAAGFEPVTASVSPYLPGLSVHEMGTARMGDDARTSVLNAHNQAWDCPNLFVTDAACFVSGGSQNPTLTIMAITVRACRYIVDRLKSGALA